jgi:class I fructose-bisphosphate aldolase
MNTHPTINERIIELLGADAGYLLDHVSQTIPKEQLFVPNEHHVDQIFISSSRNNRVLSSLSLLYNSGRLRIPVICLSFP